MLVSNNKPPDLLTAKLAALRTGQGIEECFKGTELKRLQAPGRAGEEARTQRIEELEATQQYLQNEPSM